MMGFDYLLQKMKNGDEEAVCGRSLSDCPCINAMQCSKCLQDTECSDNCSTCPKLVKSDE